MARGLTALTSTLTFLLPIGAVALGASNRAEAATPTYYNSLANFQADVTFSVTDDYANPGYVFIQNNAIMSAVIGETDYNTTGFNNLNIVSGGYYCAGCNGSFELSFQTTTVGNAAGVNGVGAYIQVHSLATPYYAYITFADGTTANIALPASGNFWGVAAPERIERIHFGLSMGATTQAGSFGIDNLIVGDGNIGGCLVDADCVEDMNPCTDQVCIDELCAYVANTAPCDDGNPCTDEVCSGTVCTAQPNTDPCDDDEVCTEADVCSGGLCQGSLVDCSDGNPCTTNYCDFGMGCAVLNNTNDCDDSNACTEMDVCSGGMCGGINVNCGDDNPCSIDSCDPDLGCVSEPVVGCCSGVEDCGADQECDLETNTCVDLPAGSSGGDETGTASDTGADGTAGSEGGGSSGGGSGVASESGSADTGSAGSTGVDPGTDGGEVPTSDPGGCGCTTDSQPHGRLWWLMVPLGWLLRRRRA